jgi:hypothetical protein
MAEEALEADGAYVPENIMITGAAGTMCLLSRGVAGDLSSVVIGCCDHPAIHQSHDTLSHDVRRSSF